MPVLFVENSHPTIAERPLQPTRPVQTFLPHSRTIHDLPRNRLLYIQQYSNYLVIILVSGGIFVHTHSVHAGRHILLFERKSVHVHVCIIHDTCVDTERLTHVRERIRNTHASLGQPSSELSHYPELYVQPQPRVLPALQIFPELLACKLCSHSDP